MSKTWRSRKIDSKTKNWGVVVSIVAVQSIVLSTEYSGWIKKQMVSRID
jgi:regulator of protease activity HflC (stomatin/prohibitin superfamily)